MEYLENYNDISMDISANPLKITRNIGFNA